VSQFCRKPPQHRVGETSSIPARISTISGLPVDHILREAVDHLAESAPIPGVRSTRHTLRRLTTPAGSGWRRSLAHEDAVARHQSERKWFRPKAATPGKPRWGQQPQANRRHRFPATTPRVEPECSRTSGRAAPRASCRCHRRHKIENDDHVPGCRSITST
jgi:hypothetical protein